MEDQNSNSSFQLSRQDSCLLDGNVSIFTEIPGSLHDGIGQYLDANKDWDQDRLIRAAIGLFLLQNGKTNSLESSKQYKATSRIYLDALFGNKAA